MDTGLEGKPWYVGLLVGLVVGAVLVAIFYQVVLKDMRGQIARQEVTLADLQDQIRRGESALAQMSQFQERVAQLEEELDTLLAILPDRRNVHELLRSVKEYAEDEDFDLQVFRTGREVQREYFDEWPMTVALQGTYHNLARFFDRLSHFRRIINVDNLRIDATRAQRPDLTIGANFVAKTFVYRETEEVTP